MTLTVVLFGYIARITRAGVIEALDSDYTRTASLKGLPSSVVVRKHVLRNALPPTIAVVAVQIGYLFGGLVAVEYLFNYQGIGLLVLEAARQKDLPLLTAGVLVVAIVYLVVTLVADILYALLNPRIRLRRPRVSTVAPTPPVTARSEARTARSERLRLLVRSPTVVGGALVIGFWIFCALFPGLVCPYNPIFDNHFPPNEARPGVIRSAPTRTAATSSHGFSPARGTSS